LPDLETKQLVRVALVREFAASVALARESGEVFELLQSVLTEGLGECSFAGYVRRDGSLQRAVGTGFESLAELDVARLDEPVLAVPCAKAGAFVLERANPLTLSEREFIDTLASCSALALQKAELNDELTRIRRHDPLTGLANRGYFFELAERELSLAKRHNSPLSLILLDVDHFKRCNEEHGPEIGDEILQQLGVALLSTLRTEDVLARYGSEEFVFLLPRINLPDATWGMGERLRKLVEDALLKTSQGTVRLTVSLGVSTFDDVQDDLHKLLKRADEGVSMAKTLGRNRCVALDLELMAPEP
jgi:diguanylate cyclase (GGDEF)-like protein